jgi:hypothetical protein
MAYENHWLPGFNFNVEEWDAKGLHYKTLQCRSLAQARAVFAAAIAEKPAARFMIRQRIRVVKRTRRGIGKALTLREREAHSSKMGVGVSQVGGRARRLFRKAASVSTPLFMK